MLFILPVPYLTHTHTPLGQRIRTTEDNDLVVIPPPAKTLTIDEKVMF